MMFKMSTHSRINLMTATMGFFFFWLISILTKPEEKNRIESFFDNMRRKSDALFTDEEGRKPLAEKTGDDLL
ncbi:MAG: hypothetical protein N2445_07595, partial [Acidobacteria bacterium]|nr:hypothetical protein [Acidobacteriota bacterium]